VGAALGVAIAGTVVNASRAKGYSFTLATHPIWWAMTGCGATVLFLGWTSATRWARESADLAAFTPNEIAKIGGNNFLRVFGEAVRK
jgi:hypothetical protein